MIKKKFILGVLIIMALLSACTNANNTNENPDPSIVTDADTESIINAGYPLAATETVTAFRPTVDAPQKYIWTQTAPYPEAAPSFTDNKDGTATQVSNGGKNCFGRVVSNKFDITAGETYFFSVTAKPENLRDEKVNLHVIINWYDKNWDKGYWPPITKRDYLEGVRVGDEIIFSGYFSCPPGLVLSGNKPVDAILAEIEFCLKWSETGSVTWKDIYFTPYKQEERSVKTASIFAKPKDKISDSMDNILKLIDDAAKDNPDIILFNETALTPNMNFIETAVTLEGDEIKAICAKAKEHNTYIIIGLAIKENGVYYNVALLISPDGKVKNVYKKLQIPLAEAEKGLTPGDEIGVYKINVNGKDVKIGILICWDAEFPELSDAMFKNGAEIIFVPTNGNNALGYRAKEAGAYLVLSCNPNGPKMFAPSGEEIASGKSYCVFDIDLNKQYTYEWISTGPAHAETKSVMRQERRYDIYEK
jgi:hypothetical protein